MKNIFRKMMVLRVILISFALLLSLALNGENIKVLEQNGSTNLNPVSLTTKIVFYTPTNQSVSIYSVYYHHHHDDLLNMQPICTAPAVLEISNGIYDFNTGGAFFSLNAAGGTQYWKVRNGRSWEQGFGLCLSLGGPIVGVYGLIVYGVGNTTIKNNGPLSAPTITTTHDANMLVLGIVGLVSLVPGFILIYDGRPYADLINIKFKEKFFMQKMAAGKTAMFTEQALAA